MRVPPPNLYIPAAEKDSAEFDRFLQEVYRDIRIGLTSAQDDGTAMQTDIAALQSPAMCAIDLNGVAQAITVNVITTLPFVKSGTDAFDTHSYWDVLTSRYVPLEEGYYNVSLHITFEYLTSGLVAAGNLRAIIRKNGSNAVICRIDTDSATAIRRSMATSKVIYCNGSTDYIDFVVVYDAGTALSVLGEHNRTFATIAYVGGPTAV